jgi:predicted Co/Zn/Cd cation transporter (cation efflux family)
MGTKLLPCHKFIRAIIRSTVTTAILYIIRRLTRRATDRIIALSSAARLLPCPLIFACTMLHPYLLLVKKD